MTPERWQQIENVFHEVLEQAPAERAEWLQQHYGEDEELRREVASLLDHEVADTFLHAPIQQAAQAYTEKPLDELIGQALGVYRVTHLIGHGGMGAVYKAMRADGQFEQQVAIKIIRRGMETDFVRSRFTQERRILARLEHPNIARLLDGGTTAQGQPYFVMEYVEGRTIHNYCMAQQLSLRERLQLFRRVCAAVQFAHQNLVVHRDLKPSNILVAEDGTPKLLDFGIAKLLSPDTEEAATQTETAMRLMTPDYASPEQVRGLPITTASDIYSLGVVLYELLTDHRPHQFHGSSPLELERVICETVPEKPSATVSHSTMPSGKLARQLAGDLDNIVLMALRKEPERRYSSAEQFSEDIRRYLEGLPVIARQDTLRYRTEKFLRRNKWAVAAMTLIMLSLVGGMATTTYQQRRAERRFQQVRKLANTFLFDFYNKVANLPGSIAARESVAKTGLEYLDSLAQEAKGDAGLQVELAQGYIHLAEVQGGLRRSGLEQFEAAMASYRKALTLGQELVAQNPNNTQALDLMIRCYTEIADFQRSRVDLASAQATMREALSRVEKLAAQPHLQQDQLLTIVTLYHFNGDLELELGNQQAAEQSYRRALEVDEQMTVQFPGVRAQHSLSLDLATLGDALAEHGDLKGALEEYQKALDVRLENVRLTPNNNTYRRELALLYDWMGNYAGGPFNLNLGNRAKAEQYYRQCLTIEEEIAAADTKNVQGQMDISFGNEHLANVLLETNPTQAIELYRKALAVLRPLLENAPDEFRYLRRQATQQRLLAVALQKRGERANAFSQMREALTQIRTLTTKQPANAALKAELFATLQASAALQIKTGEQQEAAKKLAEALALAEELAKARPHDLQSLWRLADVYTSLGHYETTLATQPDKAASQLDHWRAARDWLSKSLTVWDGWSQHGISSIFNLTHREHVVQALAVCDAASAKLGAH